MKSAGRQHVNRGGQPRDQPRGQPRDQPRGQFWSQFWGQFWACLTLMRPANVVTALADIGAGAAVSAGLAGLPLADLLSVGLPGLLAATAALYAGGVVLNDVFDAALDARERPERAIPSGRVGRAAAAWLGAALLALGIACAVLVSLAAGAVALATAAMILLYDARAKGRRVAGPLTMGGCRGLNLLLGVAAIPAMLAALWPLALLPVAYIAAITAISQGEVHGGDRRTGWLAVVLLGGVLATLLGLAFAGSSTGSSAAWWALPFLALLAWRTLPPFAAAARRPEPALIGAAVRAGVLSLILLDAALAAALAGPLPALAVLALWPLSMALARAFAVT